MWVVIVLIPDHCLSIYFIEKLPWMAGTTFDSNSFFMVQPVRAIEFLL